MQIRLMVTFGASGKKKKEVFVSFSLKRPGHADHCEPRAFTLGYMMRATKITVYFIR